MRTCNAGQLPGRAVLAGQDERPELLARQLGRLFSSWGYRYVEPPLVEDLTTFSQGSPGIPEEKVYRFLDSEARLVALRPDMTAGIARLVAQGISGAGAGGSGVGPGHAALPLRLRYEGSVFRNEAPGSGRSRAIRQAGVELIGEAGLEADAEIIGLAMAAARAAGAMQARPVIGHVGLAWGALAAARGQGDASQEAAFRRAISERDLVELERILGPALAGPFVGGPYAPGEAEAVLEALTLADGAMSAAARQAGALLAALPAYGVEGALLDLALLRDLDYYTGVVFEIVQPGHAEPLAGGGRYDRLLGQFGMDAPATGFALNLDVAAPAAGGLAEELTRYAVAWSDDGDRAAALAIAASLRADGLTAESLPAGLSLAEASERAAARGATRLLHMANGGYRELRLDRAGHRLPAPLGAATTTGIH